MDATSPWGAGLFLAQGSWKGGTAEFDYILKNDVVNIWKNMRTTGGRIAQICEQSHPPFCSSPLSRFRIVAPGGSGVGRNPELWALNWRSWVAEHDGAVESNQPASLQPCFLPRAFRGISAPRK